MNKRTIAAPAAAFFLAAALSAAPPDAAKGKVVYAKQCAACHGPEGVAREAFAKRMGVEMRALGSKEVLAKSDDELRKNITAGTGKMHPVKLSADDAGNVIAYLRTLGKAAPATKAEPATKASPATKAEPAARAAAAGDAAKGKAIYTKQCAACHGPDGVAREAFAKRQGVEMRPLGSKEVLAKSDDELRKNITEGTGKMHPVKLNPDEAQNVVAYLRTLGKPAAKK